MKLEPITDSCAFQTPVKCDAADPSALPRRARFCSVSAECPTDICTDQKGASTFPVSNLAEGTPEVRSGRWTKNEHVLFEKGIRKFGKCWKKIATTIRTRTVRQVRTHAQKYLLRIGKDALKGRPIGTESLQKAATPSAAIFQLESKALPLGVIPLDGTEAISDIRAYADRVFRHELRFARFEFVNRKGIALPLERETITPVLHMIVTTRSQHHTFGTMDTQNQLRVRITAFVPPMICRKRKSAPPHPVTNIRTLQTTDPPGYLDDDAMHKTKRQRVHAALALA